jgi:hypothetical protein
MGVVDHRQVLADASYAAVMYPIVEIVRVAQDRGEARAIDPHVVAGAIVAMIEGNTVAHRAGYGGGSVATMSHDSLDLILYGLSVEDGAGDT